MDIKPALKGQYQAGLKMLRQAIEVCPDKLWTAGRHPRTFWRIAYHTLFFTHLYAQVDESRYTPWNGEQTRAQDLWDEDEAPEEPAWSRQKMVSYLDFVDENIDRWVDEMDLESTDCGIPWYKNFPKLDHQLLNIRHIQGHVGQLSELLMARGIDVDWVSRGQSAVPNLTQ